MVTSSPASAAAKVYVTVGVPELPEPVSTYCPGDGVPVTRVKTRPLTSTTPLPALPGMLGP